MFPTHLLNPLSNPSAGKGWLPAKRTPALVLIIALFGVSGWAASPGYPSSSSALSRPAALGQTTPQGTNIWTRNSPQALIYSLAIDRHNPDILYAGSEAGEVFKSTNGGASWNKAGLLPWRVDSLAIDPNNPDILYALSTEPTHNYLTTLFKSTDGGAIWNKADTGLPESNFFRSPVIDPNNSNTLYLSDTYSPYGVYKSTDGGASWNKVSNRNIDGYDINWLLAIDPINANTLYGATIIEFEEGSYLALFKSTDGGANWTKLSLDGAFFFAVSPSNPNILYASLGSSVFKSTDGGSSWQSSNTGLPGVYLNELVIDPVNPDVIYAGTYRGVVFKSVDGGTSWNPLNNGLPDYFTKALTIDPSGTFLHAGTGAGVFDYHVSASCEYALSSASQAFEINGGTGNMEILASGECSWTAVSLADWISFPAGNNAGSGNGRVSYTVAANNRSTHPRTGTLTIGTRSFTVTQAAPPVVITGASVQGKNLYVDVENFDPGGVILINGVKQKTIPDEQYPGITLLARKAGKKIAAGQSVKLQVRNPNGDLSPEFTFRRP